MNKTIELGDTVFIEKKWRVPQLRAVTKSDGSFCLEEIPGVEPVYQTFQFHGVVVGIQKEVLVLDCPGGAGVSGRYMARKQHVVQVEKLRKEQVAA